MKSKMGPRNDREPPPLAAVLGLSGVTPDEAEQLPIVMPSGPKTTPQGDGLQIIPEGHDVALIGMLPHAAEFVNGAAPNPLIAFAPA